MPIAGKIITTFKRKRALRRTKAVMGLAYAVVAAEMQEEMQTACRANTHPPASVHGEFPAKRSGNFSDGINVTGTHNGITVASKMKYGWYLEYGTPRGQMMPRTWAHRVMVWDDNRSRWEKRIAEVARQLTPSKAKRK